MARRSILVPQSFSSSHRKSGKTYLRQPGDAFTSLTLSRVTVFGTSPRYLSDLKKRGIVPSTPDHRKYRHAGQGMKTDTHVHSGEQFDLSRLRIVTSTGSVLSAEQYDWFYDVAFPPEAQLVSMSGGTDIAGCCAYTWVWSMCQAEEEEEVLTAKNSRRRDAASAGVSRRDPGQGSGHGGRHL